MITHYELLFLKETHPDYDLLYVSLEDQEFVFRSLTREEYNEIINIITNDYEFEDAVCQCTLVYPEEYDFSRSFLPGLSSKVASDIVKMSLINNPKSILSVFYEEKELLKSFDEQCMIIIKTAFPEINYDDITNWTWKKIMKYTARAESILNLKGLNISLIDRQEELEEEINEKVSSITDKELGDALREQGIDPMDYFSYEFNYEDKIEYPIIGTINWNDEETIKAIREQMKNADEKRKFKKELKFIK